jgi:Domain of unknown function (DUF4337)
MTEGIELPERHHGGEDDPLVLPVSITISIMAVLVAAATLMGHRAHTEELLRQSQAADKWAQYQAKSVRLHETQGFSDVVNIVASLDKEEGRSPAREVPERSRTLRERQGRHQQRGEGPRRGARLDRSKSGPL